MKLTIGKVFFLYLGLFFLSLISFKIMILQPVFFILSLIIFGVLTFRKLEYGIYILLGDLFATSFGYLFQWQGISLRIGMAVVFAGIVIAKVVLGIKYRVLRDFDVQNLKNFVRHYKALSVSYILLLSWLAVSFIHGLLRNGFASSFVDADRYVYLIFLAIIPALKVEKEKVFAILKAGLLWMLMFVSFIEIAFARFGENELLYTFVRDFRFGEITPFVGNFWRVFLQSEVYAVMGFLLAIVLILFSSRHSGDQQSLEKLQITNYKLQTNSNDRKPKRFEFGILNLRFVWNLVLGIWDFFLSSYGLLFVSITILLLSLSRSFWLGTGVSVFLFFVFLTSQKNDSNYLSYSRFISNGGYKRVAGIIVTIIISIVYIMLISNTGLRTDQVVKARVDIAEPAASSRSAQVGPLVEGIKGSPVIGYGYGKHLEYISSDPRVVQSTAGGTGKVSTYAFELAWLDVWLKTGVIGVLGYLIVLALLIHLLYRTYKTYNDLYVATTSLSLIALVVIHLFTPYLNHPLGIGFIMIALIVLQDRGEDRSGYVDVATQ